MGAANSRHPSSATTRSARRSTASPSSLGTGPAINRSPSDPANASSPAGIPASSGFATTIGATLPRVRAGVRVGSVGGAIADANSVRYSSERHHDDTWYSSVHHTSSIRAPSIARRIVSGRWSPSPTRSKSTNAVTPRSASAATSASMRGRCSTVCAHEMNTCAGCSLTATPSLTRSVTRSVTRSADRSGPSPRPHTALTLHPRRTDHSLRRHDQNGPHSPHAARHDPPRRRTPP